jgi:hypothetical protein
LLTRKCLNAALELIGNIQLVCIEQEDDPVNTLGKPFQDSGKIIATVNSKMLNEFSNQFKTLTAAFRRSKFREYPQL